MVAHLTKPATWMEFLLFSILHYLGSRSDVWTEGFVEDGSYGHEPYLKVISKILPRIILEQTHLYDSIQLSPN